MIPEVYRIDSRKKENSNTFTLSLSPIGKKTVKSFIPGQFNMLYSFGAGEVPISISGPQEKGNNLIHTIRSIGSITKRLEKLKVGDLIGIRGPFGKGWPLDLLPNREVVIVAGGVGLASMRSLIYACISNKPLEKLTILYGVKSPSDILFHDELKKWSKKFPLEITVDHPDDSWKDHVGPVTSILDKTSFSPEKTLAFICGPEVMMHFCIQDFLKKGLPPSSIFLSMERNLECATGHCGHCQWGSEFICKDGPVFRYDQIEKWFKVREF